MKKPWSDSYPLSHIIRASCIFRNIILIIPHILLLYCAIGSARIGKIQKGGAA